MEENEVPEVPVHNQSDFHRLLKELRFHVSKLQFDPTSPLTKYQFRNWHLISSSTLQKFHSFFSNLTAFRHFHHTQTIHIHISPIVPVVFLPPSISAKLSKCPSAILVLPSKSHTNELSCAKAFESVHNRRRRADSFLTLTCIMIN